MNFGKGDDSMKFNNYQINNKNKNAWATDSSRRRLASATMDGEGAITAWLSILIVDPFTAP